MKFLIDKFEKTSLKHNAPGKGRKKRESGDNREVKQNHTTDRNHAYHFQLLFSITSTGSAYIMLCKKQNFCIAFTSFKN